MDGLDHPHDRAVGAEEALALTRRMSGAGHRATRWLAVWVMLYGIGIGIVGVVIGASGGRNTVVMLMGAWGLFVALTIAWSSRQRAVIRGMGVIMAIWAVCFAFCWGVTVGIGSWRFPHAMGWWVGCAIVTVLVHLVIAAWIWRRSVQP